MADAHQPIDWPLQAMRLHLRFGEASIDPVVAEELRDAGGVLVACSGGADSVFLLCILFARSRELGIQLHLAHYNHRWRGKASDADADFVASLAESFDLPFYSDSRPENEAAFTETTARALRLEFLRRAARENECGSILFGHQLDDIIETQLQRIARGCASDGLAAPRPVARFEGLPTHLRPILHLRAGDVRMALNTTEIPWCEDRSNDDVSIARNALRKHIIPDLAEALGRDPSVGAARTRRLLEEDAFALDQIARERLPDAYGHAERLDLGVLAREPVAVLRRGLLEWLSGHRLVASVGASALDMLIEAILNGRVPLRMSAGAHFIVLESKSLGIEKAETGLSAPALEFTRLRFGEPELLSTGNLIQAEVVEIDAALRERIVNGAVDVSFEAILAYVEDESLAARAWVPGDRFRPLGAPGTKKVKDWFIDRRVPLAERKTLPLVVDGSGEVIWIPGFPPAESRKIQPSTKTALRLTYQARNPL